MPYDSTTSLKGALHGAGRELHQATGMLTPGLSRHLSASASKTAASSNRPDPYKAPSSENDSKPGLEERTETKSNLSSVLGTKSTSWEEDGRACDVPSRGAKCHNLRE